MKRVVAAFFALLLASTAYARKQQSRPRIYGIAHVRIGSTSLASTIPFFKTVLGYYDTGPCKNTSRMCSSVNGQQFVEIAPIQMGQRGSFVEEVGFLTSDAAAMRKFLLSHGLHPGRVQTLGYLASHTTYTNM